MNLTYNRERWKFKRMVGLRAGLLVAALVMAFW